MGAEVVQQIIQIINFKKWLEDIRSPTFPTEFDVAISGYGDQPILDIANVGFIRLFLSGAFGKEIPEHYLVHMLRGETPGAGTILYFAALEYVLRFGPSPHFLASDSTLSPDAVRARMRMQTQYADYLYIEPHPYADTVKVHRNDKTDWRRPATAEEATMWRLKKLPPFKFNFRKN